MTHEDPLAGLRRRFPTGEGPLDSIPTTAPPVPFAARYGVVPAIIELGKHGRPPTRTTTSIPSQTTGDGDGKSPRRDDTVVTAND